VFGAVPFLRRRSRAGALVLWSVATFLAGVLVDAYLPVRASALYANAAHAGADVLAWGDARTPSGLAWVLSARTFATKAGIVHGNARPFDLPYVFMEELEAAFAMLAPVGAYLLLRRRPTRAPGAMVLVALAGSAVAALVAGFDPENPDIRGYLGPAIALAAVLSVVAIGAGVAVLRWTWLRPALASLLVAGALTRFPSGDDYPSLRHAAAADAVATDLLGGLPPRAALLTAHFETAFLIGYQRAVEGRRPDVAWAHLGFARSPGYASRVSAAEPALGPVIEAHRAAPLGPDPVAALDARRPVRLEPDEHIAPALLRQLLPAGSLWRVGGGSSSGSRFPSWMFPEAERDRQVRGFLAFRAFQDARLMCDLGLRGPASNRLRVLTLLLPQDRDARALAERCR
jgi:hypothetical protein